MQIFQSKLSVISSLPVSGAILKIAGIAVNFLRCAAKLIKNLSPRDHVIPTLREPYWLPTPTHINFKICLLMYESIQTHLLLMFPHLLHLVHLSNPDELYDLRLKLNSL